jgi:hypothetical protein
MSGCRTAGPRSFAARTVALKLAATEAGMLAVQARSISLTRSASSARRFRSNSECFVIVPRFVRHADIRGHRSEQGTRFRAELAGHYRGRIHRTGRESRRRAVSLGLFGRSNPDSRRHRGPDGRSDTGGVAARPVRRACRPRSRNRRHAPGRCPGKDVAILAPILSRATTLTPFTSGGAAFTLYVRPLLPDEVPV